MRPRSNRWALGAFVGALLIAGCSTDHGITGPFVVPQNRAFVITTDFSTGALSVVNLDDRTVTPNVATVHSDATLRLRNGLVFVVNRFGQDNIQIIDPERQYATVRQYSTDNGSNPQDIAFSGARRGYISRYGSAEVLVVDAFTGFRHGTISLADFADSDGLPEMARMITVGPFLFIACQRLTNFAAANPSVVVVIDTRTDTVVDVDPLTPGVQAIPLVGRNPVTDFVADPSGTRLLIGCAGNFGAMDGDIEAIDPLTFKNLGVVISETALGGDVGDVVWHDAAHSYAVVSDASFNASLVAWNPTTGSTIGTVYAPGGFSLPDCERNDRDELYVCDNHFTAPGLRVFRAGADTLIVGPLNTGLPPSQIAFR